MKGNKFVRLPIEDVVCSVVLILLYPFSCLLSYARLETTVYVFFIPPCQRRTTPSWRDLQSRFHLLVLPNWLTLPTTHAMGSEMLQLKRLYNFNTRYNIFGCRLETCKLRVERLRVLWFTQSVDRRVEYQSFLSAPILFFTQDISCRGAYAMFL